MWKFSERKFDKDNPSSRLIYKDHESAGRDLEYPSGRYRPASNFILELIPALLSHLALALGAPACDIALPLGDTNVKKKNKIKNKNMRPMSRGARFRHDKRRKHRHWQVTVYYHDSERFARVYIDRERAARFAERQKKSPVVRATRILEVD